MYCVSYCFKYAAKLQQNVSINKEMITKCFYIFNYDSTL